MSAETAVCCFKPCDCNLIPGLIVNVQLLHAGAGNVGRIG